MSEYGPLPYASPFAKGMCAVPPMGAFLAVLRGPADAVAEREAVAVPDAVADPGALLVAAVWVPEGAVGEVPLPVEPLPRALGARRGRRGGRSGATSVVLADVVSVAGGERATSAASTAAAGRNPAELLDTHELPPGLDA
ncbi:hypothetical protein [Streptomyces sp. NPDC052721]|uniref:hypothetical protein n=1 Tax=Streptomyces sp. NPDC052721 TaxID=3154955 RepID=UPI003429B079